MSQMINIVGHHNLERRMLIEKLFPVLIAEAIGLELLAFPSYFPF